MPSNPYREQAASCFSVSILQYSANLSSVKSPSCSVPEDSSFTPPQKGAGMMLEGAGKETTDKLAGILAAKHII